MSGKIWRSRLSRFLLNRYHLEAFGEEFPSSVKIDIMAGVVFSGGSVV